MTSLLSPTAVRTRPLRIAVALLIGVGTLLLVHAGVGEAREAGREEPTAAASWAGPWPDAVLETAATLPVQAEGRIKPLDTWARFALLGINGRRTCKRHDKRKITALAWFLDAVFRPKLARTHRCFVVDDRDVLREIGLGEVARKKRDRYSYQELASDEGARRALAGKAAEHRKTPAKERSRLQNDIVDLDGALRVVEGLLHLMDFAREEFQVDGHERLRETFGGRSHVDFSELLAEAPELSRVVRDEIARHGEDDPEAASPPGRGPLSAEAAAISRVLNAAFTATQRGVALAMLPPVGNAEEDPEWYAVRDVTTVAMMGGGLQQEHLADIRMLQDLTAAADRPEAFAEALNRLHERVVERAEARGEYGEIEREVAFYALDPFGKALVLYLLAFALIAVTWLKPTWRVLEVVGWALLWATVGLHAYGILQRCLIRGRPPISTLYETVIFITAVGVASMLVIEHINRRRLALSLAPVLGALGLFIAGRYEVLTGTDTMPQLQAVLDTNFWLATHVTCISIGYCAGLLASALAHVYVLGKAFGLRKGDDLFYREVGRMVYGVICFALLFSLVGTILGGIWANDSWGRFWGWDPKENGALLIVLTLLAILHGRMGGLFRTFGMCMGAIVVGVVVAFSWWHVNHLGVGLHSYGFTSGIIEGLLIFYATQAAVLLGGTYAWLRDRKPSQPTAPRALPSVDAEG